MQVECCPTNAMLFNIQTNTLQGSQFRALRDQMLTSIPLQECVMTSRCGLQSLKANGIGDVNVLPTSVTYDGIDIGTNGKEWITVESKRKRSEQQSK